MLPANSNGILSSWKNPTLLDLYFQNIFCICELEFFFFSLFDQGGH